MGIFLSHCGIFIPWVTTNLQGSLENLNFSGDVGFPSYFCQIYPKLWVGRNFKAHLISPPAMGYRFRGTNGSINLRNTFCRDTCSKFLSYSPFSTDTILCQLLWVTLLEQGCGTRCPFHPDLSHDPKVSRALPKPVPHSSLHIINPHYNWTSLF